MGDDSIDFWSYLYHGDKIRWIEEEIQIYFVRVFIALEHTWIACMLETGICDGGDTTWRESRTIVGTSTVVKNGWGQVNVSLSVTFTQKAH